MITSIITVAGSFVVGSIIGWFAHEYMLKRAFRVIQRHVTERIQSSYIPITITQKDGVFYIHNQMTGEFLGQGSSRQEVTGVLNQRFPDKIFVADSKQIDELGLNW